MARTWLSIRVDLVEGRGERYWPRPGRIFAAARSHTFRQLADAIDDAFARWDRSQLQEFTLTGQIRLCRPDRDQEIEGEITGDYQRARLSRLRPGEQFVYVFDLGDDWAHLCTVGAQRIDPVEELGIVPGRPLPYWGWGDIPDQYRRRWGTATTATHRCLPTPGSLIFHRSGRTGGPPANGRGPGSRRCRRPSAHPGQHRLNLQALLLSLYKYAWSRGMVTIRGGLAVFPPAGFRVPGWLPLSGQASSGHGNGQASVRGRGCALPESGGREGRSGGGGRCLLPRGSG